VWSGNPNGTLVAEVHGLAPGRVLDVGAGEGGDAVWLAEQGWRVTASDISQRALGRVRAEAERRRLPIQCHHADANSLDAYPTEAFDLVSAQYASIPRTPDDRAVDNLMDAVAPGGTLLVVSHDLEPMRAPVDTHTHSQAFDPDAYVRVHDFAAALADSPEWDVEVHGTRPRPSGAASAHHVDDVVLRARRRQRHQLQPHRADLRKPGDGLQRAAHIGGRRGRATREARRHDREDRVEGALGDDRGGDLSA
jgi:SAM-dependent methyltransferase